MRVSVEVVVVSLALLVVACPLVLPSRTFVVPESWGYGEIRPPPQYRQWWAEVEDCSGLAGSFESVRWYVVTSRGFMLEGLPSPTAAFALPSTRSIYLASRFATRTDVIKHESLHLLLAEPGHPVPPFGVCAPVSILVWQP